MNSQLPRLYFFNARSKRVWLLLILFILLAQLTFTLIFFITIPVMEICITFSLIVFFLFLPVQIVALIRWKWANKSALEIHENGIAWRDQGWKNQHAYSWDAITNFGYWKNDPSSGILLVYLRHEAHPFPIMPMSMLLRASMERKFGTAFIIKSGSIQDAPADLLEQLENWRNQFTIRTFTPQPPAQDDISRFMPL
jgi:hypothetical protein